MCLYTASIPNTAPCATHTAHRNELRLRVAYTAHAAHFKVPVLEELCLYNTSVQNMTHKNKASLRTAFPRDDVSVHRFDVERRAMCNPHDTKNDTQKLWSSRRENANREKSMSPLISRTRFAWHFLHALETVSQLRPIFRTKRFSNLVVCNPWKKDRLFMSCAHLSQGTGECGRSRNNLLLGERVETSGRCF